MTDVPPGKYSFPLHIPGYSLDGVGLAAVTVSPGQVAQVEVTLAPLGRITGQVRNRVSGEGVMKAEVVALRRLSIFDFTSLDVTATATSDAEGRYELRDLAAGDYYLALRIAHRPAIFYPSGEALPGSEVIHVGLGAQLNYPLVTERPDAPVLKVSGKVAGDPSGYSDLAVSLLAPGTEFIVPWLPSAPVVQGTFHFEGVRQGSYLIAVRGSRNGVTYCASRPLYIGSKDEDQVIVDAPRPATLHVKFKPPVNAEIKDWSGVAVTVHPAPPFRGWIATMTSQIKLGEASIGELSPSIYCVAIQTPAGSYGASLTQDGIDISTSALNLSPGGEHSLVVTLAAGGAEVDGQLDDPKTENPAGLLGTASRFAAVLIPESAASSCSLPYYHAFVEGGKFRLVSIRPGAYRLFVVTELQAVNGGLNFARDHWSSGVPLVLEETDRRTVTVRPAGR